MNFSQTRQQWSFYLRHSLRDLARNGSRTIFALFCIATGVTAVVALRSLALMIGDELTLNLAEINRGDIQIAASDDINTRYYVRGVQNEVVFTEAGVEALRDWAARENVDVQFASNENLLQITPLNKASNAPVTIMPILIEPETWPFYGAVFSSQPEILPLSDLFPPEERSIVMSKRAALDHELEIGDQVSLPGQDEPFTITAFVDDETEGSFVLRNGAAGIIGFMYYPLNRADELGLDTLPQTAYVRIPLGRDVESVDKSLERRFGRGISRITTLELEEQNRETADLINDLILVMGLSSVLIGGIGIINTMNVIVGRRTLEIAVLKTLGLKAWRVTVLFLVEAALMGLIGSLIGVLAGIILSYFVRGIGEEVLNTTLSWRAYPDAWFSGFSLGLVITISFGFLPTLNAGQVRPAGVLRPNEIQLPNAGLKRTLSAVIFVILLFGMTLNIIVRDKLDLPVTLTLGLGGFIIGLFGGVMLANEGVLKPIPAQADSQIAKNGVRIFAGSVAVMLLVILFAVDLFNVLVMPKSMVYGIPLLVGSALFALLYTLTRRAPQIAVNIARAARQLLLLGGAMTLGGLVGGGIFALARAVARVLYPDDTPGLIPAAVISAVIGLLCMVGLRARGRSAAGMVGLSLIGAAFLSVVGFGIGDLLEAIFENTAFWNSVETMSTGIVVVEIITLALGASFAIIMGLVWLVARIPSFGNVDLKLSLRNIRARKARTASTMLGLIAGIGALSLITLTTSGVTAMLESRLETDVGGNVLVLSPDPATGEAVKKRLDNTIEGVDSYMQFTMFQGRIILVNGEEPQLERFQFGDAADGNRREFGSSEREPGFGTFFTTVDMTQNAPDFDIKEGRYFTEDDIGSPVMVVRDPFPGSPYDEMGIRLGSTVTIRLKTPSGSEEESIDITFTIIGIVDRDSNQAGVADSLQAPAGSIPQFIRPQSVVTVAQIQDEYVDAAIVQFAQISNAFALEIGFIVQLVKRLLDQLIAIPALVAVLALVAGIAIIANTVALDTQERRRQIGIMKAVGLKGYRVLGQLVFENAFIGLVAGLIGVSIGVIATLLVGVLGDARQVGETLRLMPALRLVGMAVIISVLSTLLAAWTAASENPMNVLRYE